MSHYIAMWSGPRNISTAIMRSFENRSDCYVSDEPFYAYYLKRTGEKHPLKNKIINQYSTDYEKIISSITGIIPNNKSIWYQKHMAHHHFLDQNIDWIEKMVNCILIRHPSEVIKSYSKKNKINSILQLGYPQLKYIFDTIKYKIDINPVIIDSTDLLYNPENILKKVCKKIGIPFLESMLSWPRGKRETDGIWGKYWYKNVESSTNFKKIITNKIKTPICYKNILNESMKYYNYLYDYRLK